jgi:2'-5' RNA ligase
MRLFFAVEIPTDKCFFDLHFKLRGLSNYLRPVDPEKQHITLKFIGDPKTSAQDVIDSVSEIGSNLAPFELRIESYGAFPNWKRPSVLWVGLSPLEPLRELAKEVDNRVHEEIGSDLEKRRFRGHITVARYKGRMPFDTAAAENILEEAADELKDRNYVIPVKEFHLINSTLTPKGPVYGKISTFPLKGSRE